MKKKHMVLMAVAAMFILTLVAVARGRAERELILKAKGVPMANLTTSITPNVGPIRRVSSRTDSAGKGDISNIPQGPDVIIITLGNAAGPVCTRMLELPTSGSRTFDFRGSRTICTTRTTYAHFGWFEFRGEKVEGFTTLATLPDQGAEPPAGADAEDRAAQP